MAQLDRAALKAFFETGDKPTESQFSDFIDSILNIIDDSPLIKTEITLIPADVLTIFSNPKIVIPAPGPNKYIFVSEFHIFLDFNSIPYSFSESGLSLQYTDAAGTFIGLSTGIAFPISGSTKYIYCMVGDYFTFLEPEINSPIVVTTSDSNPINGNSNFNIVTYHKTIEF